MRPLRGQPRKEPSRWQTLLPLVHRSKDEALAAGVCNAASLAQLGAADKTLSKDDLAWSFWEEFSAAYGWDPIVPRDLAVHFPDLLASRLGLFTLYAYPLIKGRGRPDAHPRSVFNNYPGAICRILKRDYKHIHYVL